MVSTAPSQSAGRVARLRNSSGGVAPESRAGPGCVLNTVISNTRADVIRVSTGRGVGKPALHIRKVRRPMSNARDIVELRDGSKVTAGELAAITLSVESLPEMGLPGILAQFDIVAKAHNPSYEIWDEPHLVSMRLIDAEHNMHDNIRAVIRNSYKIANDGVTIERLSPYAADAPQAGEGE